MDLKELADAGLEAGPVAFPAARRVAEFEQAAESVDFLAERGAREAEVAGSGHFGSGVV